MPSSSSSSGIKMLSSSKKSLDSLILRHISPRPLLIGRFISTDEPRHQRTLRRLDIRKLDYYTVLGLDSKCTDKEIRDAYIGACKKFHPDANIDPKSTEQFQLIKEAYECLSKPSDREMYDRFLHKLREAIISPNKTDPMNAHGGTYDEWKHFNDRYNQFWEETKRRYTSKEVDPESYYGIKGIRKQSHSVIVGFCGIVALVGVLVHIYQFLYARDVLLEDVRQKSNTIAMNYRDVRQNALDRHRGDNKEPKNSLEEVLNP